MSAMSCQASLLLHGSEVTPKACQPHTHCILIHDVGMVTTCRLKSCLAVGAQRVCYVSVRQHCSLLIYKPIGTCREAASAEIEHDQLQEVQLALQKLSIAFPEPQSVFDSLGQAVGTVLLWLNNKTDGRQLNSKGFNRFEKVWETHRVMVALLSMLCSCKGFTYARFVTSWKPHELSCSMGNNVTIDAAESPLAWLDCGHCSFCQLE